MPDRHNTKEQQDVASVFEEVREQAKGFDLATERLDIFFESLLENSDEIVSA